MKHEKFPRLRGIQSVRADGSDLPAVLAELNKGFAAFKQATDDQVAELKKGLADVVTAEKVDRINADISALTKAVDDTKLAIDAARLGGGGKAGGESPEVAAHRKAFNTMLRRGANDEQALRDLEVKASLSTDSNPDGGFLVPPAISTEVDRVLTTVSAVRGVANVVQIGGAGYSKIVTTTGAASGWVSEREARPETTNPKLSEIKLAMGELYANPATTQRLLEDSAFNVESWLAGEIAIAFAEAEGAAFISGDGVDRPRGILAYDKVANASYSWGKTGFVVSGAAAAFASSAPADAFIDLHYALKSGYRDGAVFLISDAVLGTVRKFKDGDGTYLWQPPTAEGPATILGKTVITDENMPAVGAGTFPVAFGNFGRAYQIADRVQINVLRDPFTNKPFVHFYATRRVGGGIVNFEAIKLMKISA